MTDRELLELAAKAAGIRLEWDGPPGDWVPMYYFGKTYHGWNPLEDYADAIDLALRLRMSIVITEFGPSARTEDRIGYWVDEHIAAGEEAGPALCRAIVRAASEHGKAVP